MAGPRQRVGSRVRLADDRGHHMVIPPVRVIVSNDDRQAFPLRQLLQAVDGVDQEDLLVLGVGLFRVAGLVRRGVQEAALVRHVGAGGTRRGGGAGEIRTREPSYPGYGISSADSFRALILRVAGFSTSIRLERDWAWSSTVLQRNPVF